MPQTASLPIAKTVHEHARGELTGISGRCDSCQISIKTVKRTAPSVCPFCHARLLQSTYRVHPFTPEPTGVTDEDANSRNLYQRPSRLLVRIIQVMLIVCLSVATYYKLHNLEYFWYQPMINFYSVTVGIFILSRFLLAAFYMAPVDSGYEPTVSVVVACMNEEGSIEKTIGRSYQEGYPREKLEVIVVNDGSTDNTLPEMMCAQGRHPDLIVVDFEKNKGKRHGMAVGTMLSQSEVLVMVDSDSFLMKGAIRKVVQGLADPTVAAVSGHTDVENVYVNTLTMMQDLRYYVSYRVMKAAEHIFGAVSCCPGCFSAYRRTYVLKVLRTWLHQRFLGAYATYGDDRSLTNYLLRDYRILYDDEAIATTIVPEKWGKYIKQQCRWKRSWVREFFFAGRWFWRKHPVAAISWYAMTILPLIAPLVMFNALVIGPIVQGRPATFYIGGVFLVTLLWSLYYLEKTGRRCWWTGFVFVTTYVFFFSWQAYYAVATMYRTTWGTR